jgi:hypothetical protein
VNTRLLASAAVSAPADPRAWLARARDGAGVVEGTAPRFIDPW